MAQHVSDARAPRLDEFARGRDRLRAPVRRVEEREWLPIPDPSVHHPAGLGQAHVLVRDDVVLPTALLVEESGEVPLSLVVRRHPLGGRSDVRDARRCGGAILDNSDDQAEHVSLLATCHPITWPPETAMSTTVSRCRWMPSRCITSCVDWLQCVRQSNEGRMTWDWRPMMAGLKHPRHYDEALNGRSCSRARSASHPGRSGPSTTSRDRPCGAGSKTSATGGWRWRRTFQNKRRRYSHEGRRDTGQRGEAREPAGPRVRRLRPARASGERSYLCPRRRTGC